MTLSLQDLRDSILAKQQELMPDLEVPLLDPFAVLLLSKPIAAIGEHIVMDFFGAFWVHGQDFRRIGYFEHVEEAIGHAEMHDAHTTYMVQ